MKIRIIPESDDEKVLFSETEYDNVVEFALIGVGIKDRLLYTPFHAWNGDKHILIGKIAELGERIRDSNHSS